MSPSRKPPGGVAENDRLDVVLQRAQRAFDSCVKESAAELPALIRRLIAVQTDEADDYHGDSLREVMRRANDVRGVAKTLGAARVAEVANTIFEFAEAATIEGRLPKPLIALLAKACLHLADDRFLSDQDAFFANLEVLVAEARRKNAEKRGLE